MFWKSPHSHRLPWAGIEPLLLSGAVSADPVQRGIIYAILVGDFSIMSEWSLATQVRPVSGVP